MGNSFAHAVNLTYTEQHGQSRRAGMPIYKLALCSLRGAETVAVPMHGGTEHPSRIVLPIIDGDDAK